MKRYPIGIHDFQQLREGNYMYVDKTAYIHTLIQRGNFYFLSRPRRFGKSLLLSTIKYLFQGKRNLFEGLWIEQESNYSWESYPVFHFSFNNLDYKNIGLEKAFDQMLNLEADRFKIQLVRIGIGQRFTELIEKVAARGKRVIILIDEYDKPIIDYIDDYKKGDENREFLKNFFSPLKGASEHIKFLILTGVSKFSKVSLFSDLNHLSDISMESALVPLTGYTQKELESNFTSEINEISQKQKTSVRAILNKIKFWYNGYSWRGDERIYNPFSVLNLMQKKHFDNYWWESGTPTFLLKLVRDQLQFDVEEVETSETVFYPSRSPTNELGIPHVPDGIPHHQILRSRGSALHFGLPQQ